MLHLGSGLFLKILEDGAALLRVADPSSHELSIQSNTTIPKEAVDQAGGMPLEITHGFQLGKFLFQKDPATGKWSLFEVLDNVKRLIMNVGAEVVSNMIGQFSMAPAAPPASAPILSPSTEEPAPAVAQPEADPTQAPAAQQDPTVDGGKAAGAS